MHAVPSFCVEHRNTIEWNSLMYIVLHEHSLHKITSHMWRRRVHIRVNFDLLLQFFLSTIYLVEVTMPATMVDIANGNSVNGPRMRLIETRWLWNHIVSSQVTLTTCVTSYSACTCTFQEQVAPTQHEVKLMSSSIVFYIELALCQPDVFYMSIELVLCRATLN